MRFSRTAADLLLLAVCVIWGGSFVVVRDSVQSIPPFLLIGGRFLLASFALAIAFPRSFRRWRESLGPGLILSSLLLGGFVLQTYGLRYTEASTSGFITGLNVIFVALIAVLCGTQKLTRRRILGVALAAAGMTVLSWRPGGWHFGRGDLLTLGCAAFFALHIVATGLLVPDRDPVALSGIQFTAIALVALGMNAVLGEGFDLPGVTGTAALCYLGLAATAFAFLVQTVAQRHTSAVDTAIIFSTEPLFAAAIAVLLGGEPLTIQMLAGGSGIFGAMLLSVLTPSPAALPATSQDPGRILPGS